MNNFKTIKSYPGLTKLNFYKIVRLAIGMDDTEANCLPSMPCEDFNLIWSLLLS